MKKILFLIFTLFTIVSCNLKELTEPFPNSAARGSVTSDEGIDSIQVTKPIGYGNGVYYFDCTDRQFAISLADFLSDTTKHIEVMTGDGSSTGDIGYFVVVK